MTHHYYERQKPVIDILLLLIVVVASNVGFLLFVSLTLFILIPFDSIIAVILINISLQIRFINGTLQYKFFPYHLSWKIVDLNRCTHIETIEYNAIADYRGIGRRHLIYKNEKAYITKYNGYALRLKDKDGTTYTFSIKNPDEVKYQLTLLRPKISKF